ncbi:tripartite motif-containing protein 2-like isoform X2 [Pollicipes pollicipes]|uniref:tripartite motif-containing protein 2-like isoform X2 n=1 Tax=Pollicipes pollicipes TaxID=41117 RepID=UPI001884AE5C|nr:tripartite motif-containing protein 2-like isoform X2 [Pollicipes pollicipes]
MSQRPVASAKWCRLGEKVASMSSTLVETVSINYEDFNESFLTCGTCLCTYDGAEHTPKLMPCSHTVCLECLARIVASNTREPGTLRCPICRALIPLPTGGAAALPPSFVVNQLLDLMSRQRREVVPKCSTHQTEDLLFCETCDTVFCALCCESGHGGLTDSCEHTVVPFSIAIKRMSEILLYKANECISKLNKAHDAVQAEIHELEHGVDATFEQISTSFQELIDSLERRRAQLLTQVKTTRDEKKSVLEDQLRLIEAERSKVQSQCDGLQYQVQVRNITRQISELNQKLDSVSSLSEPRENGFVRYEYRHNDSPAALQAALAAFGRVRTSRTFPGLCQLGEVSAAAHLQASVRLTALDYHGERQTGGGDPVTARLSDPDGEAMAVRVTDLDDGTYQLTFRPRRPGPHALDVRLFGRPVARSPLLFDVSQHNDPVRCVGARGDGDEQFCQPVGVAVAADGTVYVTDTGNSRVKVLDHELRVTQHILGSGLEERGGTGLAVSETGSLVLVNWRARQLTEVTADGRLLHQFTHEALQAPIDVAVSRAGELLVADNGLDQVLVLSRDGRLLRRLGERGEAPGQFRQISAVCVAPDGSVLAADSRVQVFTDQGQLLRELVAEPSVRGYYGGVTCDHLGNVLATRTEKSRHYVQVFSLDTGKLLFWIDSDGSRLRRPSGLACSNDGCVFVADLGNNCLKQYRYL